MRKLYDRLLSLLNISGRDLAVFLLALLLAFSIWLIHNLSLKYNAFLDVSVQARCNIDGHAEISADQSNVVARCRATGYNVIRSGIRGRRRVVEVTFQPSVMKHKGGDIFYVTSSDLQEYTHLIYGDGVTLEYFTTDTLFFRFPTENSKKVPVIPVTSLSYQPQFTNRGPLQVRPDSVTVYGEPYLLDNINSVSTEPIKHNHLSSDVQGEVRLEPVKNVRMSDDRVIYSMDVTRYVEIRTVLPVMTINVPSDKSMTVFPSSVEARLKCVFPLYGDPAEGVFGMVDYDDYQNSLSGKCMIRISGLSDSVIDYDIIPPVAECIVEDLM